jgi:hypothetical protein
VGDVGARVVRPRGGGAQAAVLAPRELTDYVSRRVVRAQRGLAVVTAGAAVAAAVVPGRGGDDPSTVAAVALAVGALAFAAALEGAQRWLVGRPQPYTEADLVAADDAIRSQSVHSLAGAGLAVLLLLFGSASWWLAQSDVQVLRWTTWAFGASAPLLALYACGWWGNRAWRVRRHTGEAPPHPVATP